MLDVRLDLHDMHALSGGEHPEVAAERNVVTADRTGFLPSQATKACLADSVGGWGGQSRRRETWLRHALLILKTAGSMSRASRAKLCS